MSIPLHLAPSTSGRLSRVVAKAAATALVLGSLSAAVLFVAFVRTFAFEYFHGDSTAVHGLTRLLLGN